MTGGIEGILIETHNWGKTGAFWKAPTAKAAMLVPVLEHLGRFIAAGSSSRWSPLVLDLVRLGPSHEACRRYLAGGDVDPK